MTPELRRSNVLTGLVLVAGVLAFCGLLLYLQGYDPAPEGEPYTIVLASAPGITANSAVTVGGLKVGKVESLQVRQVAAGPQTAAGTEVLVNIRIAQDAAETFTVYQNATASVVTAIFGRASISLNPGGPGVAGSAAGLPAEPFPAGTARRDIRGAVPPGLDDISRQALEISGTVNSLLKDVQLIVRDIQASGVGETNTEIRGLVRSVTERVNETGPLLAELKAAAESARRTAETLGETVAKSSGAIESTITNIESISRRTDAFLGERLGGLADSLERTLGEVAGLATASTSMLSDNRGNIQATLANLRDITSNLRDMSAKLKRDPSIIVWGTDDDDNAADRKPGPRGLLVDEGKLRDSGALPVRERD